ncbi:MAG: phosphatidylserine decarboxylase [Clostridia bacterium]|nr:phosphatidylserine decarboxylase [Clostridia bacterium]
MNNTSKAVNFLYGTIIGRFLLKTVMVLHLDRIAVWFLRSRFSKILNNGYIKRNNIPVTEEEKAAFHSFRDLFARTRTNNNIDMTPKHLISPCDSWLSVFEIDEQSRFSIKNSHYSLKDFLQDEELAKNYVGGKCLIFRLCASDYHHYCYIDNGYQGKNHFIEGALHSVQPIACEKYPVYVKNRRSWCLLETESFGNVIQCEIGALIVGGISNKKANALFSKGEEKGHFELAGSTIVLLFEKGKIEIKEELLKKLSENSEVKVTLGEWIGIAEN